jgi:PPOX class probable F420-dependent enzyme
VNVEDALAVVLEHHHAVLATRRRDGSIQMSPVACGVDREGRVVVSSRETAIKVKNLRRDPQASACVFSDRFYGPWVQVDGTAEILSLPDAMEPLVDYYRALSGEHPDWSEYRAAMERDRRVLIRISVDRAGPDAGG